MDCLMHSLFAAEVSQLYVDVGDFEEPVLSGFVGEGVFWHAMGVFGSLMKPSRHMHV